MGTVDLSVCVCVYTCMCVHSPLLSSITLTSPTSEVHIVHTIPLSFFIFFHFRLGMDYRYYNTVNKDIFSRAALSLAS